MPIRVSIAIEAKKSSIRRALMRQAVRTVLLGEGISTAEISLAFVNDASSGHVNKTFLNHEGPTDVITFPWSGSNAKKMEGELIIGVGVAQRIASERKHTFNAELALYVIHGILHLCGFDDKKKIARKKMRAKEAQYLNLLKLPAIAELD